MVRIVGRGQEHIKNVQRLRQNVQHASTSHAFSMRKSSDQQLFLRFPDGSDLGYLTERLANALKTLFDRPDMEFEAFASLALLEETIRRCGKASEAAMRVNINVYGPISDREDVGKTMSSAHLFLQDPDHCRPGIEYINPHIIQFSEIESEEEQSLDNNNDFFLEPNPSQDKEFTQEIAEVFDSLRRGQDLHRVQGNDRIRIPLYEYVTRNH